MAREEPGTIRPGGRTARVRAVVLGAAVEVLAERGFARLDLGEVAQRAGVGKTTVYRRWGTSATLIGDLLDDLAARSVPRADTGSLRGDLVAYARRVLRTLTDPRQGPLVKGVIAAATGDERTAASLHRFAAARIAEWAPCVVEAVDRGEIPPGTDSREVLNAVWAPLCHRVLVAGDPLSDAAAVRAAEAAVVAAEAGVFVTGR